jgi:hypothetical protein
VPQRSSLAAPQQQGKSDSGAAEGNMQAAALKDKHSDAWKDKEWEEKWL